LNDRKLASASASRLDMPIAPQLEAVSMTPPMNDASCSRRDDPHASRTDAGNMSGLVMPASMASSKSRAV